MGLAKRVACISTEAGDNKTVIDLSTRTTACPAGGSGPSLIRVVYNGLVITEVAVPSESFRYGKRLS